MYSANIDSSQINSNLNYSVSVTFTDESGHTVTERYDVSTAKTLNDKVWERLNQLNAIDYASLSTITTGKLTPTAPVTDQGTTDYQSFSRWLSLVQLLAAAKSMGWITGNETMVVNIKTQVMNLAAANLPKMFQ